MKRKWFLLLSLAATCNFSYSLYTVFNDLPTLNKIQNLFTLLMCLFFIFILFGTKHQEIVAILNEYYKNFDLKFLQKKKDYHYTFLFCSIFLSYAHFWLASITGVFFLQVLYKTRLIIEYFTVIETTTLIFAVNAILFVIFTLPVISILKGIRKTTTVSS